MSEIADELERMAEEFETRRKKLLDAASDARREQRESRRVETRIACEANAVEFYEKAVELLGVVTKLRSRAAELRAQRTGPTYKAQPKPSDVREGQWWMWGADNGASVADPFRIEIRAPRLKSDDADVIGVYLSDGKIDNFDDEDLLTDSDWLYLGDGPEPAR